MEYNTNKSSLFTNVYLYYRKLIWFCTFYYITIWMQGLTNQQVLLMQVMLKLTLTNQNTYNNENIPETLPLKSWFSQCVTNYVGTGAGLDFIPLVKRKLPLCLLYVSLATFITRKIKKNYIINSYNTTSTQQHLPYCTWVAKSTINVAE
jgi:hypothetical protein